MSQNTYSRARGAALVQDMEPADGAARRLSQQRAGAPSSRLTLGHSNAHDLHITARRPRGGSPLTRHAARFPSAIALLLALWCCLAPVTAWAAWPLEGGPDGGEPSVVVGFEERYRAPSGVECTHRGVDLPAAAGQRVVAPAAGTVAFVGTVPRDDVAGSETMLAVSVERPDGSRITLMPFDGIAVEEGQHVAEGQVLGTTPAAGDRSSAAPHLHLGLKKDGVYLDPSALLGLPAPVVDGADEPAAVVVPAPAPDEALVETEPVRATEPADLGMVSAGGELTLETLAADAVREEQPVAAQRPAALLSSAGASASAVQAGAAEAGAPSPADEAFSWLEACWSKVVALFGTLSLACGIPADVLAALSGVCLVVMLAMAGILVARHALGGGDAAVSDGRGDDGRLAARPEKASKRGAGASCV